LPGTAALKLKESFLALFDDAVSSLRDLMSLLVGGMLVVLGLAFFIFGLRLALFPIGEGLAHALAKKGSIFWLITFAFVLGFGTTIAEPALLAVAAEAAEVAANADLIARTEEAKSSYATGLRLTVALAVGVALVLGVFRILANWSLPLMIIGGYILVVLITTVAPKEIVGVA